MIIHDPSSRFFDLQSIMLYLLFLVTLVLVVPPLRRAALAPILSFTKKDVKKLGESRPDEWIPEHIKSATSPTSTLPPTRRRKTGVEGAAVSS